MGKALAWVSERASLSWACCRVVAVENQGFLLVRLLSDRGTTPLFFVITDWAVAPYACDQKTEGFLGFYRFVDLCGGLSSSSSQP